MFSNILLFGLLYIPFTNARDGKTVFFLFAKDTITHFL